jgi:ParB/RepB/Spo0J family partition protein
VPESKTKAAVADPLDNKDVPVIPSGLLIKLRPDEIVPSKNNPRHLFDREPLEDLKSNIRQHGVLVPITVFKPKGQRKYSILDGQRRHICCEELREEGIEIKIPANVVEPPTKIAALLYMFNIHNFREQWELMPTALALRTVMDELDESDNKKISKLTGLTETNIERCKRLLTFPEGFQNLSLDPDPKTRIPSNFWIEAYPVLNLCEEKFKDLSEELGRDGITDRLVEKYRAKRIKSVIHFRRIMEAYNISDDDIREAVLQRLRDFILDIDLETRKAFDEFVVDNRRVQSAINTCEDFIRNLERLKIDYTLERGEIKSALERVKEYAQQLINKLEGGDPPAETDEE